MKKLLQPVVGVWLLFLLVCAVLVYRAQFTADMSAFLPREPSPRQQILIEQIGEGFASKALIVGLEGAPPQVLAQLSGSMARTLRTGKDFVSVSNGQAMASEKDQALLFAHRYLLTPALTSERMQVEGLRGAVTETLNEVGSSTGLFTKSLLARDPTGESLEVLKRLIPSSQPSQSDGVWMNEAGTRALLLLQTQAQGADLDAQEEAHEAVERSFEQARAEAGTAAQATTLKFSGPGVFAVKAREVIKSEAARLSTIGIFMVLGLLWLIYRSVTTLLLGVIPVATGALAGIAAVATGFSSVHGMTLGFGITLIGEAVDYAIYLFVQYAPSSDGEPDFVKSPDASSFTSLFWPTIRLGVLTSIFGFSTLLLSGFTGLAQLGLFSIAGIVVAAVTTRFVLPALLPAHFSVRQPQRLGAVLSRTSKQLGRLKVVAVVATMISVGLLASRWSTLWSVELGGLSPVSEAAQKLDSDLRQDLGAPDAGILVVVKATSSEQALQLSEAVTARLEPLIRQGEVGGYQAASTYLPSQRTQTNRQTALPDDGQLRQRTAEALKSLPLRPERLEGFFADVAQAKTARLLTRTDLEGTSLSLGVDSLLYKSSTLPAAWTALIALQPPAQNGALQSLKANLIDEALSTIEKPQDAGVFLIELRTEASDIYNAYLREAILLSSAGFIAIVGLLLFVLRSVPRVLRVVMPLLASASIVAAALAVFNGQLTLLHLIGLLLVIAIGSNYALFFDQRARVAAGNDHNMLCSLFFANLTTVLGFGLLAFSSVPVMKAIGTTVGAGTFLALMLSAVFATRPTARTS